MSVNDRGEGNFPRVLGKEHLIVIVVICSSLSFIIGYFAGRNTIDRGPGQAAQVVDPIPSVANKPSQPVSSDNVQPVRPPQPHEQPPAETAQKAGAAPKETPPSGTSAEQKGGASETLRPKKPDTANDEIFTVQLAAIKSAAEARKLKEGLKKKGYKVYVKVAKNKKNERIYKLRTGEFTEKKEAEILALKLTKTEGVQAFVTLKNE